jgi:hypothetical protein
LEGLGCHDEELGSTNEGPVSTAGELGSTNEGPGSPFVEIFSVFLKITDYAEKDEADAWHLFRSLGHRGADDRGGFVAEFQPWAAVVGEV